MELREDALHPVGPPVTQRSAARALRAATVRSSTSHTGRLVAAKSSRTFAGSSMANSSRALSASRPVGRLQSEEAKGAAGGRHESSATAWARPSMSTGFVR
jgi:hypothetical protein